MVQMSAAKLGCWDRVSCERAVLSLVVTTLPLKESFDGSISVSSVFLASVHSQMSGPVT